MNMTYEFDGKEYERASVPQKEWGNRLISRLNLKGDERILDLGCGDGELSNNLADLVPQGYVLGIDSSRGMIDAALAKERDNLEFRLMDINRLELDEEFDLVFSNSTLHWIKEHGRLWSNISSVLSSGGSVWLNFAGQGNISCFIRNIREVMSMQEYEPYFQEFDWPWYMPAKKEYEELIYSLEMFSEINIWEENADRYLQKDELIKLIDQPVIVPFLACIPGQEKEKFRETLINKLLEESMDEYGRCFETFRRINLFCRK